MENDTDNMAETFVAVTIGDYYNEFNDLVVDVETTIAKHIDNKFGKLDCKSTTIILSALTFISLRLANETNVPFGVSSAIICFARDLLYRTTEILGGKETECTCSACSSEGTDKNKDEDEEKILAMMGKKGTDN